MYQRIIVPVDGSMRSWKVADAASELAARWDCPVEVVSVVRFDSVREQTQLDIESMIAKSSWQDRAIPHVVTGIDQSVGAYIAEVANDNPGSLVVMSTTGHGRSAALLGSTAEEILQHTVTPILLYGPRAEPSAPKGEAIVVAVDGTDMSEQALGLAGVWSVGLDLVPWVVTVGTTDAQLPPDVSESAGPHALAGELAELVGREVQFDTLHGNRPAAALTQFAESVNAAALVEATHGRHGFDRFLSGSVTMATVRQSHIPVLVVRGIDVTDPPREEVISTH